MFEKVGLIAKSDDPGVEQTLTRLISYLTARNCAVVLDVSSGEAARTGVERADRERLAEQCDLAIIVGGDGTFLNAARSLVGSPIRLLGVNMGRLGFLADIIPEQMTQILDQVFAGRFNEERRFLLRTTVLRDHEPVVEAAALNDVVAHKWHIARLLDLETFIDRRLVSRQRSDGLIIATPTGSTAYALSSGGPIVHPSLDALVVVPICPHTLTSRPIVVQGDSEVEVVLASGEQPQAQLTCDGQTTVELAAGDRIHIRKHPALLRLVHPASYDYYATLRAKLHWSRES